MKTFSAIVFGSVVLVGLAPTASADNDDRLRARVTATGDQEVVSVDTAMTGVVRIEIEDDAIEVRVDIKNNSGTIVAAHIHCAAPGTNGPVGLNLGVSPFTKHAGRLVDLEVSAVAPNGCGWTSVDDVAAAIEAGNAYVNVHTVAHPAGEIRGNLTPLD